VSKEKAHKKGQGDELALKEKEREAYKDKWLRAMAE